MIIEVKDPICDMNCTHKKEGKCSLGVVSIQPHVGGDNVNRRKNIVPFVVSICDSFVEAEEEEDGIST